MPTPNPRHVGKVVNKIRPLLKGIGPELQGAVLGDLVAIFLAGHHPALREGILQMHVDLVRALIPVNVEMIFPNGIPDDWRSH